MKQIIKVDKNSSKLGIYSRRNEYRLVYSLLYLFEVQSDGLTLHYAIYNQKFITTNFSYYNYYLLFYDYLKDRKML